MEISLKTKIIGVLGGVLMLAAIGFVDFITGYRVSVLVFYLLPILYVLKRAGLGFAFAMAVLAALVWVSVYFSQG